MANRLSAGDVAEIVCRYKRGENTPRIARAMRITNSAVVGTLDKSDVKRTTPDRDFWVGRATHNGMLRARRALVAATLRMAIRDAFVIDLTRIEDHPNEYEEGDQYYNRDEAYEWLLGDTAALMWDVLGMDAEEARRAIRQWRQDGLRLVAHSAGDKWLDAEGRQIGGTGHGW